MLCFLWFNRIDLLIVFIQKDYNTMGLLSSKAYEVVGSLFTRAFANIASNSEERAVLYWK